MLFTPRHGGRRLHKIISLRHLRCPGSRLVDLSVRQWQSVWPLGLVEAPVRKVTATPGLGAHEALGVPRRAARVDAAVQQRPETCGAPWQE